MRYFFLLFFSLCMLNGYSQWLKLKTRASAALSVSEFSKSISDSSISLDEREMIIFNEKGMLRVVIYGWHKPDGKAIQPLYNGHSTVHADYSHGIRLVHNKVWLDGKKTTIQTILRSETLHPLLSDEGVIEKPYYPTEL